MGGHLDIARSLCPTSREQSRHQLVVERLREAIAQGHPAIGVRLPSERELCEQLGVSRTYRTGGDARACLAGHPYRAPGPAKGDPTYAIQAHLTPFANLSNDLRKINIGAKLRGIDASSRSHPSR